MSTDQENPCLACTENQRCCSQLSGLRLSEAEFEKYFRDHSDQLTIIKDDKTFIVSSHGNGPCPYWQLSGCKIYNNRPVDCRVYPYEITEVLERKRVVEVRFRDSPGCPQRDRLFMPLEEAKALLKDLGQAAYGQEKPIIVRYAEDKKRSGLLGVFSPLVVKLFQILKNCVK